MWDFSIQTDHVIEAQRPDLVLVDKKERSKIIDFPVPGDSRIGKKEKDKIKKYQDLGSELKKTWKVKVKLIPLVVGSLGAIPKCRLVLQQEQHRFRRQFYLERLEYRERFLKSKATGCGLI